MNRPPALWIPLVFIASYHSHGEQPNKPYQRTTVQAILKHPKVMDGKRVEIRGTVMFGFEMSAFRDEQPCEKGRSGRCAIWVKMEHCSVRSASNLAKDCNDLIGEFSQGLPEPTPLTMKHVTLRGTVFTIRRDIRYTRSAPGSARIGFGHLGAYPAQIQADEMVLDEAQ